MQKLAK